MKIIQASSLFLAQHTFAQRSKKADDGTFYLEGALYNLPTNSEGMGAKNLRWTYLLSPKGLLIIFPDHSALVGTPVQGEEETYRFHRSAFSLRKRPILDNTGRKENLYPVCDRHMPKGLYLSRQKLNEIGPNTAILVRSCDADGKMPRNASDLEARLYTEIDRISLEKPTPIPSALRDVRTPLYVMALGKISKKKASYFEALWKIGVFLDANMKGDLQKIIVHGGTTASPKALTVYTQTGSIANDREVRRVVKTAIQRGAFGFDIYSMIKNPSPHAKSRKWHNDNLNTSHTISFSKGNGLDDDYKDITPHERMEIVREVSAELSKYGIKQELN